MIWKLKKPEKKMLGKIPSRVIQSQNTRTSRSCPSLVLGLLLDYLVRWFTVSCVSWQREVSMVLVVRRDWAGSTGLERGMGMEEVATQDGWASKGGALVTKQCPHHSGNICEFVWICLSMLMHAGELPKRNPCIYSFIHLFILIKLNELLKVLQVLGEKR